ncbi:hypothetical protein KC887_05860 [Candidatus Kaiserbacteria bacterium]|nr:hypothetical protein [Candidatus Kaiserbacteria bacterium]
MVRVFVLLITTLLLAGCVDGSRSVEVVNQSSCQYNPNSPGARQACADLQFMLNEAARHGARGFDMRCDTYNGTAAEIRHCTAILRQRFEDAGVNFGNPGSTLPVYPSEWNRRTNGNWGRSPYGYQSPYRYPRPHPPRQHRCWNQWSGTPWECMPGIERIPRGYHYN